MKRTVAAAGALVLASALLAGCGSSGDTEASTDGGPVNLTFWHGYTAADGTKLNEIIDQFNTSQSKVKVSYQVKTWAVIGDTLLPALSAKKGPQLVAMPSEQLPVYAGKGAFADLDAYYSSSPEAAKISPEAVKLGEVEGKKYAVPTGFVPLSVVYNKTMFAKAGIKEFPTTWDQWVADAKKL
ncbi:MAG TPA: extracellular solute-binding protein, partial [Actinomycetales bacterium]